MPEYPSRSWDASRTTQLRLPELADLEQSVAYSADVPALHATAYCGIPAGLGAFRAAHEVLVSEGVLPKPGAPAR
jgi:hypothetical protein